MSPHFPVTSQPPPGVPTPVISQVTGRWTRCSHAFCDAAIVWQPGESPRRGPRPHVHLLNHLRSSRCAPTARPERGCGCEGCEAGRCEIGGEERGLGTGKPGVLILIPRRHSVALGEAGFWGCRGRRDGPGHSFVGSGVLEPSKARGHTQGQPQDAAGSRGAASAAQGPAARYGPLPPVSE